MKTPTQKTARSYISLSHLGLQLVTLLFLYSANFATGQDLPSLDVMAGKALFDKAWVSAPASTAASDGLGPFFNGRSCATCHQDGGRGAVPEALNIVTADQVYGHFLQTRAVQGLRAEAQVKISTQTRVEVLADGTEIVMHAPDYALSDLRYGALATPPSARIAPALTGLHFLEQVPEDYLQSLADPEDRNGDGISGRLSKVPDVATGMPVTGRFGWKAESYSLQMQIAKALSLDMGLGNSLFPSAFGDCTVHQPDCLHMASGNSPAAGDPEVSDTILDLLLTYLRSLEPASKLTKPVDIKNISADTETAAATGSASATSHPSHGQSGLSLFNDIGCSACHLPSVPAGESQISPFTDLLLHDLGPGLAAETTMTAEPGEWRTAPLWGLASAAVYLHDGRATTLAEAILWHAGEATGSARAYRKLTAAEREVLHSWLHGL